MGKIGSKLRCKKDKTQASALNIDPTIPRYDVGNEDDWQENEMKEIEVVPGYKIIVYLHEGRFYAFGSQCPHKKTSLIEGVVVNGTIKCAAHGAEFDIESGICEDYPSYEGIPSFQVLNENGNLKVLIKETGVYSVSRPLGRIFSHQRVAVAIGSGASAVAFAQTLREGHWEGRILLISKESCYPYDKTRLSETVHLQADDMKLREDDWYDLMSIELKLNTTVSKLEMGKRKIFLEDDPVPIIYSKLFIGTGSRGKMPSPRLVPGILSKNVLTISSIDDAQNVYDKSKGKTVVIEGSGFIAMELVSTLRSHAKMCYMITRQKRPYQSVLGETVGKALQHYLMKQCPNLEFFYFDEIRQIIGDGSGVRMVKTLKKREIKCDVVVYAIGSEPNSELFFEDRRALVAKSGHIVVTEYCETNVTDVYAGGDVALVPLDCAATGTAAIAHWNFASYTGKIAAARILHVDESIKPYIPYYYTNFCGLSMRYTGYGEHYDESIIFGDLSGDVTNMKFCALYRRDRKILACATINCDKIAAHVCFNIGDHFQWEPGVYPKVITDTFKELPILGEEYFGFRLDRETCLTLYDSQSTTEEAIRRGNRQFEDLRYRDVEFPLGLGEDKHQMNMVFLS